MKKKIEITATILICIFILGSFYISYLSNISNPFSVVNSVINLEINDNIIEEISENPPILIGKNPNDIIEYMKNLGYKFDTQEGSVFFFNKDGKTTLVKSEMFTRRYVTWRIEQKNEAVSK